MLPRIGDRSLFPDLAAVAYLAHCGISPVSEPVRSAVAAYLDDYARRGSAALLPALEQRAALRGALGELVGASADDIALVPNTSTGVLQIAFSIDWRPGDRVLLLEGEFPANVTPWQRAAATFGLALDWLPADSFRAGGDGLGALEAALRRGLRLVAVSAVQFSSGLALPIDAIAALCRRHGAELFVDAIQAVGVVPIDVGVGIDYLACGSQKWLMGVEGAGFVYVSPRRVGALVPRLAGWLSHEDPIGFLFGTSALRHDRPLRARVDVLEGGSGNGAGYAALAASVALIGRLGVPAVFAHVQAWHDAIEPELRARGFRSLRDRVGRSGILAVVPPEGIDAQALVRAFAERGIVVTAPENRVRFAPSWPNALHEVSVVLDTLDAVRTAIRA